MPRLCKICYKNPAAVPDRENLKPRKEVCRECHADRLRGDVVQIMGEIARRKKAGAIDTTDTTERVDT
jgi:hypothetical protein